MSKLTSKQQRFVNEYLVDLNATQAAIRTGYSKKTARSQGQRLLTNADIEQAIQAAQNEQQERTQITADRVVQELSHVGLGDIRQLYTESGHLKPIHELPAEVAAMVSSVETNTIGEDHILITKVKLWDKNSALDKLMKHLGAYAAEKLDHSSTDGTMSPQVHIHLPDNGRS